MDMMPITAWDKHVKEGAWEIMDFNGKWIPLTASVRPNECRPHGAPGFHLLITSPALREVDEDNNYEDDQVDRPKRQHQRLRAGPRPINAGHPVMR
jgi:hypothetical protein